MNVEAIHRLIDDAVTGGVLAWVKKTTLKNAYSEFIEKLADVVPEHETPIAIAFDVLNAHANDRSFNVLCTDEGLYVDDLTFPRASETASDVVRIPLSNISEFSFIEGSVGLHELRFTQRINGVTIQSVWRQLVMSGALFKRLARVMQQQLTADLTQPSSDDNSDDIEMKLKRLQRLSENGLISEEEYAALRRKLLAEL